MAAARRSGARGLIAAALLAALGCGGYASQARVYAANGKYELAALYWTAAHLEDPADEPTKEALEACNETASRALDHDIEVLREQKTYVPALGAALRKEELLRAAFALGVTRHDPDACGPTTRDVHALAGRDALARVDALETSGASPQELLSALRVAQAYDPDNDELARRYDRTRQKLTRNISYDVDCGASLEAACHMAAARLVASVLGAHSELVRLVPKGSPSVNATLHVTVGTTLADSGWKAGPAGKAEADVPRLNRFQEPETGRDGKALTTHVTATYKVFERKTTASLQVSATVTSAAADHAVLFRGDAGQTTNDARAYAEWQGDERALGHIADVGTAQLPPLEPRALALQLAQTLGAQVAADILHQLDGNG